MTERGSGEHVVVFGNGYDLPQRMRVRAAETGFPLRISLMCRFEQLAKIEDPAVYASIVAVHRNARPQEWIELVRTMHALEPVTRIGTFGDECQELAALAGEALDIPSHSPRTVRLVADKNAMRQRLKDARVESTPSLLIVSQRQLHAFAAEHGYPLVVKPVSGTASAGVSVVTEAGQLDDALARATSSARDGTKAVAEPFLCGPQYSVECFSESGVHLVVAITKKYSDPVTLVELGHVMPAPLDPAEAASISSHTARALDALGVEFGPTHTEIVLTTSGPRIIETHLRVGGGQLWNLVTDATGVDLLEWQLRQCLGEKVLPDIRAILADPTRVARCEAIWFAGVPAAGTLVDVDGADGAGSSDSADSAGVQVKILGTSGTELTALHSGAQRLAWARAHADSPERALDLAREAIGKLEFVVRVRATARDLL
jgi:phosphoribosylamine-glycine ligase